MHLAILGAKGQLGKEWIAFCEKNGIEYHGYDLPELNITEKLAVENMVVNEKPDVLINCAAYTNVDGAESDQATAALINHEAVIGLAEVCKKLHIKLVHYSTDYVFAGTDEDKIAFPAGYPEEHETNPTNVYGITKLEGEKAIQKVGGEHLILRISWLCGAYGHNFVKTMLRLASERDELSVVNDQFGSPTFTKNVVEWTYALLQKKAHGLVHLSSAGMTNWYEFAKKIFELKGIEINVNPVDSTTFKTAATRPHFSKMDTSMMSGILGENPITWQEALQHLLADLEEYENN